MSAVRLEPWGEGDLPLLEQLLGDPSKGTDLAPASARAEGQHRFVHAFPAVDNAPSNALCRKLQFTLVEEREFEFPSGSGNFMRCNDWRLDLHPNR